MSQDTHAVVIAKDTDVFVLHVMQCKTARVYVHRKRESRQHSKASLIRLHYRQAICYVYEY